MNKPVYFILCMIALILSSSYSHAAVTSVKRGIAIVDENNEQVTEGTVTEEGGQEGTEEETEGEEEQEETCDILPICKYNFDCLNDEQCVQSEKSSCCDGSGVKSTFNACKYDIALTQATLDEYEVNLDLLLINCCYLNDEKTYFCEDDPRQCSYKGVKSSYITKLENFITNGGKVPSNCSSIGIDSPYSTHCTSTSGDKLLICAGDFKNHPTCSENYDAYPTQPLGLETQYFLCNTQLTYKEKNLFGYQKFQQSEICEYIIDNQAQLEEKWVFELTNPADSEKQASCIYGETGEIATIHKVCSSYKTKQWCEKNNGLPDDPCPYNDTQEYGETEFYSCHCPVGWMTLNEFKTRDNINYNIVGDGIACTAEGEAKYEKYLAKPAYPFCEDIIASGNKNGILGGYRHGWVSTVKGNSNETIPCTSKNSGMLSNTPHYLHCSVDVVIDEKTYYTARDSFDSTECAHGCAENYSCEYPTSANTTKTACSKCACDESYVTKDTLCGSAQNPDGTPNGAYTLCMNNGIFDENDICKVSPKEETLYKKVSCPAKYLSLDEWWQRKVSQIQFDDFLAQKLEVATTDDWKNFYTPVDETSASCTYEAEMQSHIDEKTKETIVERVALTPKYQEYELGCTNIEDYLGQELSYVLEADKSRLIRVTGCWNGEKKWFSSCTTDYWLPDTSYKPNGSEDLCIFNKMKHFKYGGTCPTSFTGNEAIVSASMSDSTITSKYGDVKITYCNEQNIKMKLLYCDPARYTQICEYPYEYTYTPTNPGCRRNINGKQISDQSPIYYSNKGEKVQCYYSPSTCHAEINRKSAAGYEVFVVDRESECRKKYGTAIKVEECNQNGETKYSCYYPKNKFVFNTSNCLIGKDLSIPYILINGVKHWDRCDCAPAYKYHFDNCDVDGLYGNICVQDVVTQEFLDGRETDPTLYLGATNIELYTGCKKAASTQTPACTNPSGIWANCYYCCPKGTKPTRKTSKDSCGKKIYECK